MRHVRVVDRVGVLADVERLLHLELRVREPRPVRAGRDLQLEHVVQVVRQHGHELRERDRAPLVELQHLALVLPLARAVLAAPELEHQRVVALQLGQPVLDSGVVGELEVGQHGSDRQPLAHLRGPFS